MAKTSNSARNPPTKTRPHRTVWISSSPDSNSYAALQRSLRNGARIEEPLACAEVISQTTCPFANLPSSKTGHWGEGITAEDMTALRWVKPKIVVEVSFVEWTRDGCCGIRVHRPAD